MTYAVGLASKDWTVRRAAVDVLRSSALLFGPELESDKVWDSGDTRCLTARCLRCLEQNRFDKVR
jgi:hypothetical protein